MFFKGKKELSDKWLKRLETTWHSFLPHVIKVA